MAVKYKTGTFVDYAGNKRNYVMAAVVEKVEDETMETYTEINKIISLGVSACNINDKFNEELGKTIALGKAKKYPEKFCIMFSCASMARDAVVNVILDQEANHFEKDPGFYLKGYDKAKAKTIDQVTIDENDRHK